MSADSKAKCGNGVWTNGRDIDIPCIYVYDNHSQLGDISGKRNEVHQKSISIRFSTQKIVFDSIWFLRISLRFIPFRGFTKSDLDAKFVRTDSKNVRGINPRNFMNRRFFEQRVIYLTNRENGFRQKNSILPALVPLCYQKSISVPLRFIEFFRFCKEEVAISRRQQFANTCICFVYFVCVCECEWMRKISMFVCVFVQIHVFSSSKDQ